MNDPYLDAFRYTMHMTIKAIASRHMAALRRTWKTQDFLNRRRRSAAVNGRVFT